MLKLRNRREGRKGMKKEGKMMKVDGLTLEQI